MTAICGGGTSGPKTGSSAVVLVSSGVIATILEKSGNPWLEFAAALLTLPELVLSTFCATDPPAMPTFTSAESSALLNITFGPDLSSGLTKFTNMVLNLAWQEYCNCTSGALVVPPPVTPPAGTPIYQPPKLAAAGPCVTGPGDFFALTAGGSVDAGPVYQGNSGALHFGTGNVPTSLVMTTSGVVTSFGTGSAYTLNVDIDTGGTALVNLTSGVTFPTATNGTVVIPIPTLNARICYPQVKTVAGGGTGSITGTLNYQFYCNGAAPNGQLPSPCCPPDVATQSSLDLILKTVTLLQRQLVPFAYIASTAHTGLSGNGTITVHGLLGIQVDVTTLPSRAGHQVGDPTVYWDLGWVNLGTADGFGPRQFIGADPTLLLPISAAVTVIGYSIPSDVTVTITELVREP